MNIHTLKSFHESALDHWNSISVILTEAASTSTSAEQRHQNFIKAVLALSDVAGDNQRRKANIIKGADIALHGLIANEIPQQAPSSKKHAPPSKKPSFMKKAVTIAIRTAITLLVIAGIAGAFFLGRSSMRPTFSPIASFNIPAPASAASTATPEELVQQYFEAARTGDMAKILALCDREKMQYKESIMSEARSLGKALSTVKEVRTLSVERDETAKIMVELLNQQGRFETGEFRLKSREGRWVFTNINF